MQNTRTRLIVLLSGIGLIDALYLSYTRFTHSALSCDIFDGCNVVAASPYSVLFGIMPLAYLGSLFYLAILMLGIMLLLKNCALYRKTLLLLTSGGFLSSVYFVYIQAFVIKAFCIYCLISAALSALLFFVSIQLYRGVTEDRDSSI